MPPKKPPCSNRPKKDSIRNPPSSKQPKPHANISPTGPTAPDLTPGLPLELQQRILNVFAAAFPFAGDAAGLKPTIQEVKGHLFNRDFVSAFGKQEYLAAYALRWSAARALAYADIFVKFDVNNRWLADTGEDRSTIVCIGGGAGGECAALAALTEHHSLSGIQVEDVDIADWSECLRLLRESITTPPPLSKYASESVRAANKSLLEPDRFAISFTQQDVLELDGEKMRQLTKNTKLVTLMFTLNELFNSSIAKATSCLLKLTDALDVGAWLLVVDSPGSYSEVKLGKEGDTKQYPMKWLLNHTLMEVGEGKWRKVVEEDSRWFRLDSRLKYPIALEDMRYQIHVYQRAGDKVD